MFYKVLNDEFAKNLFVVKKTGRTFSEAQKNFWFYKGDELRESIVKETAVKFNPDKCYGCFVVFQYVTEINGRRLGRNGVCIKHIFYIDDKNVVKYVKLNNKDEVAAVEVLKEECVVNEFNDYKKEHEKEIEYFLTLNGGSFYESIKNKLYNEILLSEKEKEEVERVFSKKEERQFDTENNIVIENVKVSVEEKLFAVNRYRDTVSNYYVFRGSVRGFANNAKINVTFMSVKKSCELLGIDYTTDEQEMIEMFNGKNIFFEGDFSLYGNTVVGRGVKHLAFVK